MLALVYECKFKIRNHEVVHFVTFAYNASLKTVMMKGTSEPRTCLHTTLAPVTGEFEEGQNAELKTLRIENKNYQETHEQMLNENEELKKEIKKLKKGR